MHAYDAPIQKGGPKRGRKAKKLTVEPGVGRLTSASSGKAYGSTRAVTKSSEPLDTLDAIQAYAMDATDAVAKGDADLHADWEAAHGLAPIESLDDDIEKMGRRMRRAAFAGAAVGAVAAGHRMGSRRVRGARRAMGISKPRRGFRR